MPLALTLTLTLALTLTLTRSRRCPHCSSAEMGASSAN